MLDILIDDDLDLQIANGDLVVGESTLQNQLLLITCNPGDFKENPTICVGVAGYLKDDDYEDLLPKIKKEFEKDGMIVERLKLSPPFDLDANAYYP